MTASVPEERTCGAAVTVEAVAAMTEDLSAAIAVLVPQLSSSASLPAREHLAELIASPASRLFVARLVPPGRIIGMLTLVVYGVPTGVKAVIEDVVVDETARGSGVGAALIKAALAEAERRGARHVDLTSRQSREAANRLYVAMGFKKRDTNLYRFAGH